MKVSGRDSAARHRLKKDALVMKIFRFLSDVYEQSDRESIWEIEVPIEEVREALRASSGVEYNSNQWIFTQLRRYEDEIGVKLFRKLPGGKDGTGFSLAIHDEMVQFYQKQHLYVTQKIKVANGVFDKIMHETRFIGKERPIRVLLGAGSTVYHLADILAEKSWEDERQYAIYTHNVGSLQTLLNHNVNYSRITVSILAGTIDPVTCTVVGSDLTLFTGTPFDFIVQGTSCIHDGNLYIESREEREIKHAILFRCRGVKILVLTKHEFSDQPLENVEPYGSIADYDYVVVPRSPGDEKPRKRYEKRFEQYLDILEPEIMNWNYSIFRVRVPRRQ